MFSKTTILKNCIKVSINDTVKVLDSPSEINSSSRIIAANIAATRDRIKNIKSSAIRKRYYYIVTLILFVYILLNTKSCFVLALFSSGILIISLSSYLKLTINFPFLVKTVVDPIKSFINFIIPENTKQFNSKIMGRLKTSSPEPTFIPLNKCRNLSKLDYEYISNMNSDYTNKLDFFEAGSYLVVATYKNLADAVFQHTYLINNGYLDARIFESVQGKLFRVAIAKIPNQDVCTMCKIKNDWNRSCLVPEGKIEILHNSFQ